MHGEYKELLFNKRVQYLNKKKANVWEKTFAFVIYSYAPK